MLKTIREKYIDDIEDLINDSHLYYKKILWFYGDSICSICNPKDATDFHFDGTKWTMNLNVSTCYDHLLTQEFELRTSTIYS